MTPKESKTTKAEIVNETISIETEEIEKYERKGSSLKVVHDFEEMDLDDALQEIGTGKYSTMVLLIGCYTFLSIATEIFGIGVVVVSSQCDLDLDTYRKGIIGAVPMLGIIVSSHTWGYIADTKGRRYAMLIALSGTWILAFASSFATHWISFAVLKFLSVIFASGAHAVSFAYLVEMTPRSHRNKYVMLASTCIMTSQVALVTLCFMTLSYDFSIPLAGWLTYRPWRLLCQAFALVNLIAMLLFFVFLYESPKFYLSQGREKESLEVLSNIYAVNTGKRKEDYSVKSVTMQEETNKNKDVNLLRSMWNQTAPLFYRKYIKDTMTILYVAMVAYSTGPPLVIWMPTINNAFLRASITVEEDTFCGRMVSEMQKAKNATTNLGICNDRVDNFSLLMMMGTGVMMMVIGLISTLVLRWFSKKTVVLALNTISGVGCLLLNNLYGPASFAIFLSIVTNCMVMGIVPAFAVELYPTYLRSMAVCLTIMAGRGFSSVVINVMGVQIESHCTYFFYGFAVFILSGTIVAFFLPGEKKKTAKTVE